MTTKTEAQRLADAPCHFEAPMNMRAHQDAAALLLKQEAAIKQLREALSHSGLFLHHAWCDVQMNDYSFEKLNQQMQIVDAAIAKAEGEDS